MTTPTRDTTDSGISEIVLMLLARPGARTRNELAEVLGISKRSLDRRIHGEIEWTAREVRVLASHYGLPINTLFEGAAALFRAPGQMSAYFPTDSRLIAA